MNGLWKSGDIFERSFPVVSSTGAAANADSTPTAKVLRNKVADGAVSVTITNTETGVYSATFTIPSTYADNDLVELLVAATIGGVATKDVIESFRLLATFDGTSTAVGANTLTLATGVTFGTNKLRDRPITLDDGQSELIASNTNATPSVVTLYRNWGTLPSVGAKYSIDQTSAANVLAMAAGVVNSTVAPSLDAAISSRMATYTQPTGFLAATFPTTVASPTNITAATGIMLAAATHTGAVIPRVTLTDTVTTYTGNTPQTGDNFALASGTSGFVAIKGNTAAIAAKLPANNIADETLVIAATNSILTAVGTPAQASQIPANFTTATFASAGVFSVGALANAPTGGGSAQTGDVFGLVNPLISGGAITGTALANVPKTGYSLAPTGLDAIATTPPTGQGSPNFRQMLVMTYRRWFRKGVASSGSGNLVLYADDGTTPISTQAVPAPASDQTQGAAS